MTKLWRLLMQDWPLGRDLGLLLLRVSAGGFMLWGHGWGKLMGFDTKAASFSDPLGIGSTASLTLTVFAEVFCAAAVALGLFTRLAVIPLVVTMVVAALVVHAADPWAKKELSVLYLVLFTAIGLLGPGNFSVDARLRRSR